MSQDRALQMLVNLTASVAAIDAKAGGIVNEQSAIRDRIHDLADKLQPLMGLPRQVDDMRVQIADLPMIKARLEPIAAQHTEFKSQLEKISNKVDLVLPLMNRLDRMEPVVTKLETDTNKARGALWAASAISALIGALAAVATTLGLLHKS